jgi:arabinofuranosyltransferase
VASLETKFLYFLLLLFTLVLVRTAWVCDDAYITFRTVDNFIHGYGLTWNTSERVQAYTNPLWMFLVTGVNLATQEMFFSVIILSIVISVITALWLGFRIAPTP